MEEGTWTMESDHQRMKFKLINVLNNEIKFSRAESSIHVLADEIKIWSTYLSLTTVNA